MIWVNRIWVTLRNPLPIYLLAFLADASEAGVLRQVGNCYEFKYSATRDRLLVNSGFERKSRYAGYKISEER